MMERENTSSSLTLEQRSTAKDLLRERLEDTSKKVKDFLANFGCQHQCIPGIKFLDEFTKRIVLFEVNGRLGKPFVSKPKLSS